MTFCFNFWYLILVSALIDGAEILLSREKVLQSVCKNKPVRAVTWPNVGVARSRDMGFWSAALILDFVHHGYF